MELLLKGVVEAGFPTPNGDELMDTMSLDEYLLGNREASFMLTVRTNAMQDAGILQNDLIIVERGKEPKPNDIVILEQNGSYHIKYFEKEHIPEDATVEAVVTAVIRKYS